MPGTLRHAGILVENLEQAISEYWLFGFKPIGPQETLIVQKMQDAEGQKIELVCGNWPAHIAVNWYEDSSGNLIECVTERGGK